jgi:hypothetical protein
MCINIDGQWTSSVAFYQSPLELTYGMYKPGACCSSHLAAGELPVVLVCLKASDCLRDIQLVGYSEFMTFCITWFLLFTIYWFMEYNIHIVHVALVCILWNLSAYILVWRTRKYPLCEPQWSYQLIFHGVVRFWRLEGTLAPSRRPPSSISLPPAAAGGSRSTAAAGRLSRFFFIGLGGLPSSHPRRSVSEVAGLADLSPASWWVPEYRKPLADARLVSAMACCDQIVFVCAPGVWCPRFNLKVSRQIALRDAWR